MIVFRKKRIAKIFGILLIYSICFYFSDGILYEYYDAFISHYYQFIIPILIMIIAFMTKYFRIGR